MQIFFVPFQEGATDKIDFQKLARSEQTEYLVS